MKAVETTSQSAFASRARRKNLETKKGGASFLRLTKVLVFYLFLKGEPKGLYYNHFTNTILLQCTLAHVWKKILQIITNTAKALSFLMFISKAL